MGSWPSQTRLTLNTAKDRISEPEERSVETNLTEMQDRGREEQRKSQQKIKQKKNRTKHPSTMGQFQKA